MKRISVIIPFYGRPDQLHTCLVALEAQTIPRDDFEVIVVDNGSPHDLGALRQRFPLVRWLREERPGSFAARNRGIEIARGRILAFTDSDCVPTPAWLHEGATLLESGPATVIGGRVAYLDNGSPELNTAERFEEEFFLLHKQKYLVEALNVSATANLLALKSAFDRVGPFDMTLLNFADGDWTQRAVRAGETLRYSEHALVHHPRRRTFREIQLKVKRTAGDRLGLLRKQGHGRARLVREIFRMSPFDPTAHWKFARVKHRTLAQRLRFIAFGECMSLAGFIEKLRVYLGGEGYRG
jgi:GT2 family glycosyltransferase